MSAESRPKNPYEEGMSSILGIVAEQPGEHPVDYARRISGIVTAIKVTLGPKILDELKEDPNGFLRKTNQ